MRWLVGGLLLLLTSGCDASADEQELTLFATGEYGYGCGAWSPHRPEAALAAFDVPVVRRDRDSVIAAVAQAGGWTLPAFNAPIVRAVLPPDGVSALYDQGLVVPNLVTATIADTFDRGVRIGLHIHDSLTVADVSVIVEAGADILDFYSASQFVVLWTPDDLLPFFQGWARVDSVNTDIAVEGCYVPDTKRP